LWHPAWNSPVKADNNPAGVATSLESSVISLYAVISGYFSRQKFSIDLFNFQDFIWYFDWHTLAIKVSITGSVP
jgi:hypothetical protein